jgi:hypothetical protein
MRTKNSPARFGHALRLLASLPFRFREPFGPAHASRFQLMSPRPAAARPKIVSSLRDRRRTRRRSGESLLQCSCSEVALQIRRERDRARSSESGLRQQWPDRFSNEKPSFGSMPRRADAWLKSRFVAGTATSRFHGDHLAREGRLARASALSLDAGCILNGIFCSSNRTINPVVGHFEIRGVLANPRSA